MTYTRYEKLSRKQLLNRLAERNLPDPVRTLTLERVERLREAQLHARRKHYMLRRYWSRLLRPLMHELNSVQSGLNYRDRTPNADLRAALVAYRDVLENLLQRLRALRQEYPEMTPAQLAAQVNAHARVGEERSKATALRIPNNGMHWSDWVPGKVQYRIRGLMVATQKLPHARRREPFARRMPPPLNKVERVRLAAAILTERQTVARRLAVIPADDQEPKVVLMRQRLAHRLERMDAAALLLEKLPRNAYVPVRWQGLLGEVDSSYELPVLPATPGVPELARAAPAAHADADADDTSAAQAHAHAHAHTHTFAASADDLSWLDTYDFSMPDDNDEEDNT